MPVMLAAIGKFLEAFSLHSAASRTRSMTSSLGVSTAILSFGKIGARSRITKATSASGSAAGASSAPAVAPPGADSAKRRCGLNGGMLAERSETVSDRLPAMRTKGRTRTTSWLPTRVMVETRISWRAKEGSSAVGSRSLLRETAGRSPPTPSAPRNATSTRSGSEAKLASPSSDVKTAPPIRAAPHNAVRMVPANHCTETRRRSTKPLVPPSTDSGGSLPSSIASARLDRYAPRDRVWSKLAVPCAIRSKVACRNQIRPGQHRQAA